MAVEDYLSGFSKDIQQVFATGLQSAQSQTVYDQLLAEFSDVPRSPLSRLVATSGQMAALHETDPKKLSNEDFARVESPTGKIMFRNGVIADPTSGEVFYPPTSGDANEIRGSEPWLFRIQRDASKGGWSEAEANKWRKKLIGWGYDLEGRLAPGGGMALDLIAALRQYHQTTYLNYGKPIKMSPGGTAKKAIKEQVDMASIRADAASWYDMAELPPAAGAEKEFWADRVIDTAIKMVRGGLPIASAVAKARSSALEQFTETPEVAESIEVSRAQETSNVLRSKMFTIGQLAGM